MLKQKSRVYYRIVLLLPPMLGVVAFILQLFDADTHFSSLRDLSSDWTMGYSDGGGGMSAAPIYLGLMAIAGVYLIKDSFYALFIEDNSQKDRSQNSIYVQYSL